MKRGFTLTEVLSVIVILSILSMIVFPSVVKTIKKSKENLYQSQLRELEIVTKNFSLENKELLDKNYLNNAYISLDDLKKSKYLENTKISNPKTGNEMNGCMKISYNHSTNQYNYEYVDIDCNSDNTLSGYIITYNNGFEKKEVGTIIKSVYDQILDNYNNTISIIGGTTDGLYDIDDNYIFRGNDPHNYVKLGIGGDTYRIISLNKNDKTIKLIKNTPESSSYSKNNSNEFTTSAISEYLLNFITNGNLSNYSSKVIESNKWKNGIIDLSINMNYDMLKSVESTASISNKLGIINISDYVIASLDSTCLSNVVSSNCKNSNYLYNLFTTSSVWTLDNSTTGKIITIENGTIIDHTLNSSTDSSYRIYPVVILKKSISIKSGNGTSSTPYIIE